MSRPLGLWVAGTMRRGIAVACVAAGFDVLIADRTPELASHVLVETVEQLNLLLNGAQFARWPASQGLLPLISRLW